MVQSGGERCRPRANGWPCPVRLSAQTLGGGRDQVHIGFAERHAFLFVAAAILAGGIACAAPIQPYGPDRYIVTYSSEFGAARAQAAAVRDANKYCVEKFPALS